MESTLNERGGLTAPATTVKGPGLATVSAVIVGAVVLALTSGWHESTWLGRLLLVLAAVYGGLSLLMPLYLVGPVKRETLHVADLRDAAGDEDPVEGLADRAARAAMRNDLRNIGLVNLLGAARRELIYTFVLLLLWGLLAPATGVLRRQATQDAGPKAAPPATTRSARDQVSTTIGMAMQSRLVASRPRRVMCGRGVRNVAVDDFGARRASEEVPQARRDALAEAAGRGVGVHDEVDAVQLKTTDLQARSEALDRECAAGDFTRRKRSSSHAATIVPSTTSAADASCCPRKKPLWSPRTTTAAALTGEFPSTRRGLVSARTYVAQETLNASVDLVNVRCGGCPDPGRARPAGGRGTHPARSVVGGRRRRR